MPTEREGSRIQFSLNRLLGAFAGLAVVFSSIHYLGIPGAVILGYLAIPYLLIPKLIR
jgi:hypothetical protein